MLEVGSLSLMMQFGNMSMKYTYTLFDPVLLILTLL